MNNGIEDVLASPGGYFIPFHTPLMIPMSNIDTHNIDIYYTQLYKRVRVSSKCIRMAQEGGRGEAHCTESGPQG